MPTASRILIGIALILGAAAGASAQGSASIAGVVRDASGAVLPGVTVEASSPALIEKTRTAVTDGAGQYKIEQLRGGVYTVTFSLSGFSDAQARRHRAERIVCRHGERRPEGRRARRKPSPSPAKRPSSTSRAPPSSASSIRNCSWRFRPAARRRSRRF